MSVRLPRPVKSQMKRPSTSQQQILQAALEAFVQKGFHGATIRGIADAAGVSVPGLYHYFTSKHHLLERVMDDTMDQLLAMTQEALAAAGDDPADRLVAVVSAHVRYHISRQRESFVGNTELRSLDEPARTRILEKRDRQRALFDEVIAEGARQGRFRVPYPVEASRGLVTMCTAVASWYRSRGALSPEEIIERYCELAFHLVGYAAASNQVPNQVTA